MNPELSEPAKKILEIVLNSEVSLFSNQIMELLEKRGFKIQRSNFYHYVKELEDKLFIKRKCPRVKPFQLIKI